MRTPGQVRLFSDQAVRVIVAPRMLVPHCEDEPVEEEGLAREPAQFGGDLGGQEQQILGVTEVLMITAPHLARPSLLSDATTGHDGAYEVVCRIAVRSLFVANLRCQGVSMAPGM